MTTPEPENLASAPKGNKRTIAALTGVFGLLCVGGAIVGVLFATGTVGGKSNDLAQANVGQSATNTNEDQVTMASLSPSIVSPSPNIISSRLPSNKPSLTPSITPTGTTTSFIPSTWPSTHNSVIPTALLSDKPSHSATPSIKSSSRPSSSPSIKGSLRPSSSPSTFLPSFNPSNKPSAYPSMSPSQEILDIESFGFYLMGDTPYSQSEQVLLEIQLYNMTQFRKNNSVFTIHVGDLWKVDPTSCGITTIDQVNETLFIGPLPTFVVLGDNDYLDCPDPLEALDRFHNYFIPYETHWLNRTLPGVPTVLDLNVTRNYPDYPDMFAFMHRDVLIMSVNLQQKDPTDADLLATFEDLKAANDEWALSNIEAAYANYNLRAVILVSHGPVGDSTMPFFTQLASAFTTNVTRLLTPVLYIHGHGHHFKLISRLAEDLNWPNFHAVQCDQGGKADPLYIEIASMVNGFAVPLLEETLFQHVLFDGYIRVDQQLGLYANRT